MSRFVLYSKDFWDPLMLGHLFIFLRHWSNFWTSFIYVGSYVINLNKSKKIEFVIDAQCQATKNIFKTNKIPSRQFLFKKNNEGELGSIFTFFVLETILLARLMNINPYTQPAVEQIKIETNKYLKL